MQNETPLEIMRRKRAERIAQENSVLVEPASVIVPDNAGMRDTPAKTGVLVAQEKDTTPSDVGSTNTEQQLDLFANGDGQNTAGRYDVESADADVVAPTKIPQGLSPFSLSLFLESLGYVKGFSFEKEKIDPWTTIDYDLLTDEWQVCFKKFSNFRVYSEFSFTVGHILGAKWDGDINGFRYPATSYVLKEIIEHFEDSRKNDERFVRGKENTTPTGYDYYHIHYCYSKYVDLSELARNVSMMKQAQEDRWYKLQQAPDGESPAAPYVPDYPLMQHQQNGEEFAMSHTRCLLADDMGTGKTRQALDVAYWRFQEKLITNAIAIVPATVIPVWKSQIKFFYGDKILPIVVTGSQTFEERCDRLTPFTPSKLENGTHPLPLYIINYESARSHPVELQMLCDTGMLIMDECHKIKGIDSKVTQVIQKLRPQFAMLLTGTPIVNFPQDAFSIFHFIKPGLVGRSYDEFFRRYCYIDADTHRIGYRNLDEFNARVKPYYIRRLKKDVLDLPDKIYVRDFETLQLQGKQREAYNEMVSKFRTELETMSEGTYQVNAVNIVSQMLRLLQICDGFLQSQAPSYEALSDNVKTETLREIFSSTLSNGRKAVVFSRFVPPLEWLSQEFIEYRPLALHGGVKLDQRGVDSRSAPDTVIGRFWNDDKAKVLLCQTHTGGLGIDLSCADLCIEYDQWWAPGIMTQAEDRLHRKGQKNNVTIIPLVCDKTIEQYYFGWEYERNGNTYKGVMRQKQEYITKAIEGVNTIIPTRAELLDWLGKV